MEQIRDIVIRATSADARQERVEAYGRLVEAFRDMAVGYAYAILADFHLAEDAAQEAFIVAFEKLGQIERPEAFPGWFRQIVWSACGRLTRRKTVPTVGIEAAAGLALAAIDPRTKAEKTEMRDEVLRAISQLPAEQREVTTLFYINGYSQNEIADFLEVPVGTVKSRLTASRGRLKERMMNMVEQTLRQSAPDERFNQTVIDELLSRPRPLEIPCHPVRQVWDAIRGFLADYEVVDGEEVVDRNTQMTVSEGLGYVCPEPDRVLRTSTTTATFRAMPGRTPPVRLLTAGRVFRVLASGSQIGTGPGEDSTHLRVFHQADGLCIHLGADREAMQLVLEQLMGAVLGLSKSDLKWAEQNYPLFEQGLDLDVMLCGKWSSIAGGGILPAQALRQAGFDPNRVSCFGFGIGLERMAMLKFGIDDIRQLWRPPYIP